MAAPLILTRVEHQAVVTLLEALDGQLLARHDVVFAGGTRLTLALGEYRLSRDVDFLAVDQQGYASLRAEVREPGGVRRLFHKDCPIELPGEARIDQYGIRFPAVVGSTRIKVEFVAEGRIALSPGEAGPIASVPWAAIVDCYAEKLLANSDRWADDAFLSRDLIDLAALRLHVGSIPELAWEKARKAYGLTVVHDLEKAATAFERRLEHRRTCFERLDVRGADALAPFVEALRVESRLLLES
jgi:hypothetical protein